MEGEKFSQGEWFSGKVEIVPYDPVWPFQFEQQAELIRKALGAAAIAIDHAGSTAVPGLAAKPVLDILLTMKDSSQEDSYSSALEAEGFSLLIREPEWFEHRMFKHFSPATNLHVFSAGCPEIKRVKRFRDWLRTNETDCILYETSKRRLAARRWRSVQDYADAKTEVINEILERALSG
ncbi:MAG: GrpB family protein [Isosphaeraceae bacterium]